MPTAREEDEEAEWYVDPESGRVWWSQGGRAWWDSKEPWQKYFCPVTHRPWFWDEATGRAVWG